MAETDLAFASASTLARMLRDRVVSSRELVSLYLDRIDRLDDELGSYVEVLADAALATAEQVDRRLLETGADEPPPFLGVPVSIKDLHFLEGSRTTFGTRSWADHVAAFDEETVARLKRAGVVPLGKTNVPELGSTAFTANALHGVARNPWDLSRNAAGSSSGAAAALAAGLCAASQASDGGGSIRIPAAICGVVGLKPARDRLSNGPLLGDAAFGLATGGVLTRTVEDAARFLDVVAGYALGDPGMAPPPPRPFVEEVGADPGRLRIAVNLQAPLGWEPQPPIQTAIDRTRQALEDLGHTTEEVQLPVGPSVIEPFLTVWASGVASQPFDPSMYEPLNAWLTEVGSRRSAAEYLQAQFQLQLLARQIVRTLAPYDALLCPVTVDLALRNDRYDGVDPEEMFRDQAAWVGLTPLVNVTGQPAIALPVHHDEERGLPAGVQLVGRPWDESGLLRIAAQLEQALPWHDRRPPGFA